MKIVDIGAEVYGFLELADNQILETVDWDLFNAAWSVAHIRLTFSRNSIYLDIGKTINET